MNLDLLGSPELVIFTTRDFAQVAGISLGAASKRLGRLAAGTASLVQLTRGVWANRAHPYFNVHACVPVLLGSEQGYVSFLSALHLHGAIAQIPPNVQVATTGHARSVSTPVGTFEFLQLKPEMFHDGVVWSDTPRPYRIATVEKALLEQPHFNEVQHEGKTIEEMRTEIAAKTGENVKIARIARFEVGAE